MAEQSPEDQESSGNLPEPSQHSTADYEKFAHPEKPIRNWTRVFSTFIIIIILAGAVSGGYLYFKNHKSSKPKAVRTTSTKASTNTKSYTSPNLYLTFDYPSNWTIVDDGGGSMTVTSTSIHLKDTGNQQISGKIVMTLLISSQKLPGFSTGKNATAALASQKITYAMPTQTQRADTYISFLAYSATTATNGMDAIYVTGNNGYLKDQDIPQADLIQVSPIINITFLNSAGRPLTIAASNWSDSSFSVPILNMLKSLAIT